MGGISGAFLLLPFQVSVLHFTSPAVSATNFVYNIVAIPSGVYRYMKEGRMAWPLAWIVIIGTLPGVLIGYYLRVLYLPDPRAFKLFVGLVLLYIGGRLALRTHPPGSTRQTGDESHRGALRGRGAAYAVANNARVSAGLPADAVVKTVSVSIRRVEFEFWGQRFAFSTPGMGCWRCWWGSSAGPTASAAEPSSPLLRSRLRPADLHGGRGGLAGHVSDVGRRSGVLFHHPGRSGASTHRTGCSERYSE